jgi:hypothetical protein
MNPDPDLLRTVVLRKEIVISYAGYNQREKSTFLINVKYLKWA